ncbi:MAG: peptidylprolyl isomerase [Proteobacteria bacterium]|nr:peptidylprolyl isomerase [Pseudomonadota bacterium]
MSNSGIGRRGVLGGAGLLVAAPTVSLAAGKPRVVITTNQGAITVELEAGRAPVTSANFLRYVNGAKYDGGAFFRAARTRGAPKSGTIVARPALKAQPYPAIAHESTAKTGLRHKAGTISLGRFAPGTARGDFFICVTDSPYLDARPGAPGDNLGFAAFGQVVAGMGVVRKILASPTSQKSAFAEQKGQWLDPPVPILSARRSA